MKTVLILALITVVSCGKRKSPQTTGDPVFVVDYELDLRQDFILVKSEGFIYVVDYGDLEKFLIGDNL